MVIDLKHRTVFLIILFASAFLVNDGRRFSTTAGQSPPAEAATFTVSAKTGHFKEIVSIAPDPDLPFAATGSMDRTIRLWDTESRTEIGTLFGNAEGVRAVGITRELIVSGGNDGTVRLWDRRSGNLVKTFDTREDTVYAMAVSRSGRIAVTGHLRGTVRIWDLRERRLLHTGQWHGDLVHCVAASAGGERVFSCSRDETAVLWDVAGKRVTKRMTGRFRTAVFGREGRTLLYGLADDSVRLKDLETGWDLVTCQGLPAMVAAIGFSKDETDILAVSAAADICIWDRGSGDMKKRYPARVKHLTAAAFCPEKGEVFMTDRDAAPEVAIIDLSSGETAGRLRRRTITASDIAFSKDGRYLYAGAAESGDLMAWDLAACRLSTSGSGSSPGITAVAASPDGEWIAAAAIDGTVRIANSRSLGTYRRVSVSKGPVTALSFDAKGRLLIAGMRDGALAARAAETVSPVFDVPGNGQAVTAIIANPRGKTFFTASTDGGIREIELQNGKTREVLAGLKQPVFGLYFIPAGDFLFYGDAGHIVRGLGIRTGEYRMYRGHKKGVTAFAADPAHNFLVTADAIGGLRVYDIPRENLLRILTPFQTHLVRRIAVHPRRPLAACLGTDGRIAIWDTAAGQLQATLVAFDGGEWAICIPEGFYAASPAAASDLEITRSDQALPMDRCDGMMRELLHRPDLVADKLAGKNERISGEGSTVRRRVIEMMDKRERNGGMPSSFPVNGVKR